MDLAGRLVLTAGRNGKFLPSLPLDIDAKAPEKLERYFNVRSGN